MAQNKKNNVNNHFLLKILNKLLFRATHKRDQRQIWFCLFFKPHSSIYHTHKCTTLDYFSNSFRKKTRPEIFESNQFTTLIDILHSIKCTTPDYFSNSPGKNTRPEHSKSKDFGQAWTEINNVLHKFIYHTH